MYNFKLNLMLLMMLSVSGEFESSHRVILTCNVNFGVHFVV